VSPRPAVPSAFHTEHVMGTVVGLDVRDPQLPAVSARAAVAAAVAWLHRVDERYSPYRADSLVSRIAAGTLAVEDTDDEAREVFAAAAAWVQRSEGTFTLYPAGGLDPSGYVKGWAVERASDILAAAGSRAHLVNGGGDIQTVGHSGDGTPWRLGVADPHHRGSLLAVVEGFGIAIATSGTTERGLHLVDPRTGEPATALASVTVTGAHLAEVDAAATAAFVHGDAARRWLATQPGLEALVVTRSGARWTSADFPFARTASLPEPG